MNIFKKKKYTCVFCSDTTETSNKKIMFCRECKVLKRYIRLYGIKVLLDKIEDNKGASAPPYNI